MLDLTNRQIKILKIVVDHYNMYGTTMSSLDLQEQFGLSSATLRKELNILEKQGFLEKRHTSSGRIPTKSGYELYVNLQMEHKNELVVNENILNFLKNLHQVNVNTIEQTLDEISKLTNYTALAFENTYEEISIKGINAFPLDDLSAVLVISTSNSKNETSNVNFETKYQLQQFLKIIENVNSLIEGVLINKVDYIIDTYIKEHLHDELSSYIEYLNYIAVVSKKFAKPNMYLSGTSHLFDQSINSSRVKSLISKLENQNYEDFQIHGNTKFDFDFGEKEDDYTIVKVKSNSNAFNSLAVVGPKRMNFDEILVLLEELSKNLK